MSADSTSSEPAVPAGAIHDIGYRPYTGPRQELPRIFLTLLLYGLRGAYGLGRSGRSKVAPFLLLAAATLPAAIVVVVASVTGGLVTVGYVDYLANGPMLLVFIWTALLSPYVISRDLRHNLVTLYLSRPLDRSRYVLARYSSAVAAIFVFMLIPVVLLTRQPLGGELPDLLRALSYAALQAILLGAVGVAVAVLAPRRGMGIAAIIGVILVTLAVAGVLGDVMAQSDHESAQVYASLLSPTMVVDGVSSAVFGIDSNAIAEPETLLQKLAFGGAYVAWLGACTGVLALRYRRESVL
jgi:ABC-2 type transport system permease protein